MVCVTVGAGGPDLRSTSFVRAPHVRRLCSFRCAKVAGRRCAWPAA